MEILRNLGLVLMAMVGYSIGRVLLGKNYKVTAELFDGGLIMVLWVCALVSSNMEKWFPILLWFSTGMLIGSLITLVVRSNLPHVDVEIPIEKKKNMVQKLWMKWKIFAFRIGNFQGRLILLLFYFTIVAPFGIINRFFKDPLHEKKPTGDSFWFTLASPEKKIEDARRQY